MAQSLAALDCSAAAWTASRPQFAAEVPAKSCSFCWTASGFVEDDALGAPAVDVDDLLQAVREQKAMRARTERLFISGDCNRCGTPSKIRKWVAACRINRGRYSHPSKIAKGGQPASGFYFSSSL